MPTAYSYRFSNLGFVAIVVTLLASVATNAAGQKPAVASDPAASGFQTMGEFNGNTYLYKPAAVGLGQIFRVSTAHPGSQPTPIGAIVQDKYLISDPAEKSNFYLAVDGKPATYFSGAASSPPAAPPSAPNAAPTAVTSYLQRPTSVAAKGTAVEKTGGVMEVKLAENNDTVVFNPGGKIIITGADSREMGTLQYVGTKNASGLGRMATNLAVLGVKQGHDNEAGVNPDNYLITIDGQRGQKYGVNTENLGTRGTGDGGLLAITVAAIDVARQTKPDFSVPAEQKLRKLADMMAH